MKKITLNTIVRIINNDKGISSKLSDDYLPRFTGLEDFVYICFLWLAIRRTMKPIELT